MFKILFKSACSSHQGRVSSARFTSALPIVPSQVVVSTKSDPLRHAGLPLVKSDLPSDWLHIEDLAGGCKHLGPGRYVSVINDNH
jgi:hypothetical protein